MLIGLIAVMCQVFRIQMCQTRKSDMSRPSERFRLNWIEVTEEEEIDRWEEELQGVISGRRN